MRNIKIYDTFKSLLVVLLAAFFITSCKKNEEENLEPARLFKAGEISIASGETSAKLKWPVPILSAGKPLTYTVDFSTDQAFSTIAYTKVVDTAGITVTDENLLVKTKYYARVKANAFQDQPESKYTISSTFEITGLQLFQQIRDEEIKETTATLRFAKTVGLTSIVLKPATGTAITVALTVADAAAGLKAITGLTGGTLYTATLQIGTRPVGTLTFSTLATTNYSVIVTNAADLISNIASAAGGAVIGLAPGTYDISAVTTNIVSKSITLKSTSGDPANTKVIFKEITLENTGAGVTLSGIEFDGNNTAAYFLNLIGTVAANGAAATFTNINVDNCIVHGTTTAFLRANRGTAARDHKINGITVNNSTVYDMGANSSASYYAFHLDKLEFKTLTISKSTFYNFGAGLLTANTLIASDIPVININFSTFNAFGSNTKYILVDANTNPINATIANNIFANAPKGPVNAAAIRSSGTGSTVAFTNNNVFNLFNAVGGNVAVTFPATVTVTGPQSINLGWDMNTVSFTLPANSPLRTASTTGGPIGAPKWTY